jgi:hypothetical protein
MYNIFDKSSNNILIEHMEESGINTFFIILPFIIVFGIIGWYGGPTIYNMINSSSKKNDSTTGGMFSIGE